MDQGGNANAGRLPVPKPVPRSTAYFDASVFARGVSVGRIDRIGYLNRVQLSPMAKAARDAMGKKKIKALAGRGYFNALEIKACDDAGIAALVPKSQTSGAKADGRFDRADFIYIPRDDQYLCPAGQRAIYRYTSLESANLLK